MSDENAVTELEAPEAQTPAAPAPKYAELDAAVPDDYDDEELRGKPVKEVLSLARKAKQYEHEIGVSRKKSMEYNDLAARVEMQQKMIDMLSRQGATKPEPPELLRQRLVADPRGFVGQELSPVLAELQDVKGRLYQTQAENARERARATLRVESGVWDEYAPALAAIMHARGLDPAAPQSWTEAAKSFRGVLSPKAEVPKPAAPPAGQAKSSGRTATGGPKFKSAREERAARDVALTMGYKPGTKRYDELMAELASDGQAAGEADDE
jgi:hypothetical protein